jgi:hypothetical protein
MRELFSTLALLALMTVLAWGTPSDEVYEARLRALRERLPAGRFTFVICPPFVIAGDDAPDRVRAEAADTVGWAVRMLRHDFFAHDPPPLDVYLFKDRESYRAHCRELFGDEPQTPYGYYSEAHNALIMNIATGGGTLVHEIVHPYMRRNFPACPPWFNEGLASLYEQSGERDGHIVGYLNWRLGGLQAAIRARRTPTFATLAAMDADHFYGDAGVNYAVARYLCYYLQQRGLLRTYYRDFVKNHTKDPTGFHTLRQVLGEVDMNSFQKVWEAFVMGLSPS